MYYFTLGCLSMLAGASPSASVFAPSAVLNDGTKMPLVSLGGGYDKNQTEESIAEVGNQPHVCCTATHTRACAARIFGPNSCCSARLALALALACIRLYFTDSISPRKYIYFQGNCCWVQKHRYCLRLPGRRRCGGRYRECNQERRCDTG